MTNFFRQKVFALAAADQDEQIQVDVEGLVRDLVNEVDRVKGIKDELEAMEDYFRRRAEPFLAAAQSCASEKKRMIEGAKAAMLQSGNDRMPGKDWRIQINNGKEIVEINEVADSYHHVFYPHYCRLRYEWDKDKIEEDLKNGVKLPFAELKRLKSLNFYLNKDPEIDGKPKRASGRPKQLPAAPAPTSEPGSADRPAQGGGPTNQGEPGAGD